MTDVDTFLKGQGAGKFPNWTWDNVPVGTRYEGRIVGLPKMVDTQYGPRLLLDVENDKATGGGTTWWVKDGTQGQAIANAVGSTGLQEGGWIAIELTGRRDTGKGNPLNLFKAEYDPPVAKVDVESIFGGGDA